jgi:hypothetical protein
VPALPAASADLPASRRLPTGYRAVPLWTQDQGAPLRLCAVVRETPDRTAGALVSLGQRPDATLYLGCVVDLDGRPREWLEWWVQDIDRLSTAPGGAGTAWESAFNPALDEAWTRRANALRRLSPDLLLPTRWESVHPLPIWLDPVRWEPVSPAEAGAGWELCRNDEALTAAGLPAFGASAHRYLWLSPRAGATGETTDAAPRFLAMTADAPNPPGGSTLSAAEIFAPLIPFNPAGGLMMARPFLPLSYEAFSDLLAGEPWPGWADGREIFRFGGVYDDLGRPEEPARNPGRLFIGAGLPGERMAERFHLKLILLLSAMRAVREMVRETQMPLLNVSADSFGVRLPEPSPDLPYFWDARATLRLPGESMALPALLFNGTPAFLPGQGGAGLVSPYRPEVFRRWAGGRGTVKIGRLHRLEDGSIKVEGTLAASENLPAAANDLLRLRLRLGATGERIDFHARVIWGQTRPAGEMPFLTIAQPLSESTARVLAESEGAVFSAAPFETLPALSTPCDLHAMGVLAVRTLLVNGQHTLAAALEGFLAFVRRLPPAPPEGAEAPSLASRMADAARLDNAWLETIGPQRLTRETLTPTQAFECLPPPLWWETLAAVSRLFPGLTPLSFCADFGDAPPRTLEAVFDRPISLLESLATRSRSLIVADWRRNREMRAVIAQCKLL